jgi:hypothetical protein
MARMTTAEKRRLALEQYERENQAAWAYLREEYNRRLFKLFAQAKEFNVSLTFTEDSVSFDLNKYRDYVLPADLPETMNDEVLDEFNTVLREFEDLRSQRDEEQRRYEKKKAALAKLSPEERELLGV